MPLVMVVDDEEALQRLLVHNLEREGYQTAAVGDGIKALEMIRQLNPDLVILDLMLPGMNGLDICRRLRQENIDIPIIMLTARDEEIDKVLGLELGADDYVTKPFGVRELMARVKAILRRNQRPNVIEEQGVIKAGPLIVNLESYEAFFDGKPLELTLKEFELLSVLVRNRGRVLKREYLLDTIWGYDLETGSRVLDVHISKLREKLEEDTKHPLFIKTIRGIGYKFEDGAVD